MLPAVAFTLLSASVPIVRATPAGAAVGTLTVTPRVDLVDGQTVAVHGSGWVPGHDVFVSQCHLEAIRECIAVGTILTVDATGSFDQSLVVTRQFGTVDCGAPNIRVACFIGAFDGDEPGGGAGVMVSIAFGQLPKVVPGGAVVTEGNSSTTNLLVPLSLSVPSAQTITVQWRTASVSGPPPHADPASDFTVASGMVTFAPGETEKTVTVSVNGDTLVEPNDWIVLSFKNPTNAKMGGFWGLGFGVILNDD